MNNQFYESGHTLRHAARAFTGPHHREWKENFLAIFNSAVRLGFVTPQVLENFMPVRGDTIERIQSGKQRLAPHIERNILRVISHTYGG